MTRVSTMNVAVSADYADALMTARRAKNLLFILLLLIVLAELAVFLLARFNVLKLESGVTVTPTTAGTTLSTPSGSVTLPTTNPSDAAATTEPTTQPAVTVATPSGTTTVATTATPTGPSRQITGADALRYVIPVLDFFGIVLGVVFAVVLLVLTMIMLVGRLIGVSHVTGAFIWSVLIVLLLFPWQAFLISRGNYSVTSQAATSAYPDTSAAYDVPEQPAFKFPGVLYTYPELMQDYHFSNQPLPAAILKWARYVVLPVIALFLLLLAQSKSGRGLRLALGEAEIQVEVAAKGNEPLV